MSKPKRAQRLEVQFPMMWRWPCRTKGAPRPPHHRWQDSWATSGRWWAGGTSFYGMQKMMRGNSTARGLAHGNRRKSVPCEGIATACAPALRTGGSARPVDIGLPSAPADGTGSTDGRRPETGTGTGWTNVPPQRSGSMCLIDHGGGSGRSRGRSDHSWSSATGIEIDGGPRRRRQSTRSGPAHRQRFARRCAARHQGKSSDSVCGMTLQKTTWGNHCGSGRCRRSRDRRYSGSLEQSALHLSNFCKQRQTFVDYFFVSSLGASTHRSIVVVAHMNE
jgi:hypothetical protein